MNDEQTFQQLTSGPTDKELFESTADAAADIIMAASSLQAAAASVVALLEPFDLDRRRFHLAGVLSRLAVDAIAHATDEHQLSVGLGRVSFVAHIAWPLIDPEGENP